MTVQETVSIVDLLEAAYGKYRQDKDKVLALWGECFKEVPFEIVRAAVMKIINSSEDKFPPTIARVQREIATIKSGKMPTEMEAWKRFYEAICHSGGDGLFRAEKQYGLLPPMIQRLTSPEQLHEYALMDADEVLTVVQSNFMRSFKVVCEREIQDKALPSTVGTAVKALADKMSGRTPEIEPERAARIVALPEPERELHLSERAQKMLEDWNL